MWKFQSTRPIRGATPFPLRSRYSRRYFNPRAPYGARRQLIRKNSAWPIFQSTRPIRGATPNQAAFAKQQQNFNPRAPYGARLVC